MISALIRRRSGSIGTKHRSVKPLLSLLDSTAQFHMFKSKTFLNGGTRKVCLDFGTANTSSLRSVLECEADVILTHGNSATGLIQVLHLPKISEN